MAFSLFQPEICAFTRDGQRYYLAYGEHRVALVGFYLGEEGTMYVDENVAAPVAIATSVEKYIESDVMVNELIDLPFHWWLPLGIVAHSNNGLREQLNLPVLTEASDAYTTWWGNDRIRVVQSVYWAERPSVKRSVAYAGSAFSAQRLRDTLRDLLDAHVLSLPSGRGPWSDRSEHSVHDLRIA